MMMFDGDSNTGRSFRRRNWIVPRRTMCVLFWTGVLLIFAGMILLVTSPHKGRVFQSWGAVLLGLGLCVLLACLILCIHTYFVMSRMDRLNIDAEQLNKCAVTMTTTTADLVNDQRLASRYLVAPPRYGISVVSTPPPTVRLYVSDVIDTNKPEQEVTSSPSTDPLSSGGETVGGAVGEIGPGPGVVSDKIKEEIKSPDNGSAGEAWLTEHLADRTQRHPLPFPPSYITFNAVDHDEHGGTVMSSCDSFNHSTETIIAREPAVIVDAKSRRKSVYHNAERSEPTATSGSDTELVFLGPSKHVTSSTNSRRSRRHNQPMAASDLTVSNNSAASHLKNPASCRVTRLSQHSEALPSGGAGATSSSTTDPAPAAASRGHVTLPSTSRTFGPACVTVTPLAPIDECARFPTIRARDQPLDAADLLREEYRTSFGGDVNPLLLYADRSAQGDHEINLSKRTVYDNVHYFNV